MARDEIVLTTNELVALSRLDEDDCIALLEGVSIQCYPDEPLHVLREAVRVNVVDGTLDRESLTV